MTSNPPRADLHPIALQLAAQRLPEGWEIVASSTHAQVATHREQGLYYKAFLPRGPLEKLKALARGSRAERARKHNDLLRAAGFNAPENLAWGALSGGRDYLFCSAVPGQGVTTWLRQTLASRAGAALVQRRQLLRQLGDCIGRLHAMGITHGDLRTSNVLANYRDQAFEFAFIDNERNVQQSPPKGREVLRNLMQLNMLLPSDVTNTDRFRVFQQWRQQQTHLTDTEARLVATEAYRWAMQRLDAKGLL